jgi:hypothetical protein
VYVPARNQRREPFPRMIFCIGGAATKALGCNSPELFCAAAPLAFFTTKKRGAGHVPQ